MLCYYCASFERFSTPKGKAIGWCKLFIEDVKEGYVYEELDPPCEKFFIFND